VPAGVRQAFPRGIKVQFTPSKYEIGCRTFSPETFKKILKVAGVKLVRKPAKKGKKGKKGKK